MLSVCIPTWNRAEKLRICVESIGKAINGLPMNIKIYNNASADHTADVLADLAKLYPVSYITGKQHLPFERSYGQAVSMSDQKWTWTFGDDDLMLDARSLIPLLKSDVEFIHVTEKTRASAERSIFPGTLMQLCEGVGFIDMTGFISCNIFRTEPMVKALESDRMDVYSRAAYVHSLAALEAFHDRPAMLVDTPCVDLQDHEQTQETMQRWLDGGTSMKYAATVDGLMVLRDMGIVPNKLPPEFFRYLSGNMISKCMHTYWGETINKSQLLGDVHWDRLHHMADFIDSRETHEAIDAFRKTLQAYCDICEQGLSLVHELDVACAKATPLSYPSTYV